MITQIDPFDKDYVAKAQIQARQNQAASVNNVRRQLFQTSVEAYLNSNGKAATPTIPMEWIVNDDGTETNNTPFKDLVVPSLATAYLPSGALRPAASTVPPDRTDQIIAMLGVIRDQLNQVLAK